jgi:alkaline phosphatase
MKSRFTKTNPFVARSLLVCSGLAALTFAVPAAEGAPPKNLIFFLGDGMGPATITATRIYRRGESGRLAMERLERTARIKTYSNDAQTTDSAPSMSAYMTGVKPNNEVVSMSADTLADRNNCRPGNGRPAPSLFELAKAAGKAIGAVTTTEATHATPAATYAHICHRDLGYDIAAQAAPGGAGYNAALGDGLNVLLGGGLHHFTPRDPTRNPTGRPDGRDLVAEMRSRGYVFVRTPAELSALPTQSPAATHVLGLFAQSGHLAYELDRNPAAEPSLAEMTTAAIDVLRRVGGERGYVLMVEGGRIDHALHDTNAKRALIETAAFDDAIAAALPRVDLADTLVVVTADHDHTMAINGYPQRTNPILDIVREVRTGQPRRDADGLTYPTLSFGNGQNRPDAPVAVDSPTALGNDYRQPAAIRRGVSAETHGGSDVMLMATGQGATVFRGTIDNTEVFRRLRQALGL